MITIALNIKSCSDVDFLLRKQQNYSYAFRKLFSDYHKKDNLKFISKLQKKYELTDIELRSLMSDVATKISQTKTNKANQEQRIFDLMWDINDLKKKPKTKKTIRALLKKNKKIKELEDSLPRNITFGGKKTFRDLVDLHNKRKKIENDKSLKKKEREKQLKENALKIEEQTALWKQKRILPFYIIGESNQYGNRFFDFDIDNKTITFKPYKGMKVVIKYSCNHKYQEKLLQLKELIDSKSISITMTVTTKKICISFDDEIMSGFSIDKVQRKKDVKKATEDVFSKEERGAIAKEVYKRYYEEQRQRMALNKLPDRYVGIDPNPEYIGYCVADKGEDGIKKIVEIGVIVFSELTKKLNLPSDHPLVVSQNNKLVNEIHNGCKLLFDIFIHYKAAYFSYEDFGSMGKNEKLECREANRKIRNVWHRKITEWQMQKRCTMSGIEPIPINPVYTSFIGNMTYDYFDAVNAAIEICRRGMFKYTTGLFYPELTGTITDTMKRMAESQKIQLTPRDAQMIKDCKTWKELHKIATHNGLRWRWSWEDVEKPFTTFSMNSVKSKVKVIRFYDYS